MPRVDSVLLLRNYNMFYFINCTCAWPAMTRILYTCNYVAANDNGSPRQWPLCLRSSPLTQVRQIKSTVLQGVRHLDFRWLNENAGRKTAFSPLTELLTSKILYWKYFKHSKIWKQHVNPAVFFKICIPNNKELKVDKRRWYNVYHLPS